MLPGDEHRPMSLLERISDEPLDIKPYLAYEIQQFQQHHQWWLKVTNPVGIEHVVHHIEWFVRVLENALDKLDRPDTQKEAL